MALGPQFLSALTSTRSAWTGGIGLINFQYSSGSDVSGLLHPAQGGAAGGRSGSAGSEANLRVQRRQRNLLHPGEFIQETYIDPFDMSMRSLAENLGAAPCTLACVVAERSAVSTEMALRLSKPLGRSPESSLAKQHTYDLWRVKKSANLSKVPKNPLAANA
jgi:addiction module HigA family antidote